MKFLSSVQLLERSVERRGFTLVEMMVVISIIGILVAILYANFNQARMQARDKARQVQVQQLQVAIEQYNDKYDRYPARGCVESGKNGDYWAGSETYGSPNWLSSTSVQCLDYIVGLVPEFIPELPREIGPIKASKGYIYRTNATGSFYKFMTHYSVEVLLVDSLGHPFSKHGRCSDTTNSNYGVNIPNIYAVYSSGAECF